MFYDRYFKLNTVKKIFPRDIFEILIFFDAILSGRRGVECLQNV